jgi:DNA repair protein RadC
MKNQFINEISVTYKRKELGSPIVDSAKVAASVAREIFELSGCQMDLKEYFFVLLLNRRNQLTGFFKVSCGGLTGTVADQRIIFSTALKCLATGIVLVHNHPSGSLVPSDQDRELTNKLRTVGKLLDIQVTDHIILTAEGYYSFADSGL